MCGKRVVLKVGLILLFLSKPVSAFDNCYSKVAASQNQEEDFRENFGIAANGTAIGFAIPFLFNIIYYRGIMKEDVPSLHPYMAIGSIIGGEVAVAWKNRSFTPTKFLVAFLLTSGEMLAYHLTYGKYHTTDKGYYHPLDPGVTISFLFGMNLVIPLTIAAVATNSTLLNQDENCPLFTVGEKVKIKIPGISVRIRAPDTPMVGVSGNLKPDVIYEIRLLTIRH